MSLRHSKATSASSTSSDGNARLQEVLSVGIANIKIGDLGKAVAQEAQEMQTAQTAQNAPGGQPAPRRVSLPTARSKHQPLVSARPRYGSAAASAPTSAPTPTGGHGGRA